MLFQTRSINDYEKNMEKSVAAETPNVETVRQIGKVISVKDGVVICTGLTNISYGEMVTINNVAGMALNLKKMSFCCHIR